MVYRKFHKKRGKVFGPYYYESYRDKDKVKKIYIGGEKEYQEYLNKKNHVENVEQPKKSNFFLGNNSVRLMLFFFLGLLAIALLINFFVFFGHFKTNLGISGYAISDNLTNSDNLTSNVLYSRYTSEIVEKKFDTKSVDLEIKKPEEVNGQILNPNKNKRMDFSLTNGNIRLYFDLMNSSEFYDNIKETVGIPENIVQNEIITNESTDLNTLNESANPKTSVALTGFVIDEKDKEKIEEKIDNLDSTKVETIADKTVVPAEKFDIVVDESKIAKKDSEYKWGYKVELNDLHFMAKVDLSSDKEIKIINEDTVQIDDSILSFSDLKKQGYIVKINKPDFKDILENVSVVIDNQSINESINETINETIIFNETIDNLNGSIIGNGSIDNNNKTESNESETNVSYTNESVIDNVSVNKSDYVNESLVDKKDSNGTVEEKPIVSPTESPVESPSESPVESPVESPSESPVESPNESPVESPQESPSVDKSETGSESGSIDNNNDNKDTTNSESIGDSSSSSGITGNVIKGIIGITGKIIDSVGLGNGTSKDLVYSNKITIYLEKDFSDSEYKVGDLIEIDPTLKLISIIKASHLDSNRTFISDIYDSVKSHDDNWSEEIGTDEYVRINFEENLTRLNDITIFARTIDNTSSSIDVYLKDENNSIVRFENITVPDYYKVYLENMSEDISTDEFDLKINDNSIVFDYIFDPTLVNATSINITGNGNNLRLVYMNVSANGTLNYSTASNSYEILKNVTLTGDMYFEANLTGISKMSGSYGPCDYGYQTATNWTTVFISQPFIIDGGNLTIEPGVIIKFNSSGYIKVVNNGKIKSVGFVNQTNKCWITYTSTNDNTKGARTSLSTGTPAINDYYQGIILDSNGVFNISSIEFSRFYYSNISINISQNYVNYSTPNQSGYGFTIPGITHNQFQLVDIGIMITKTGAINVSNNLFNNFVKYGIYIFSNVSAKLYVVSNTFNGTNNGLSGTGIYVGYSSGKLEVNITDNLFSSVKYPFENYSGNQSHAVNAFYNVTYRNLNSSAGGREINLSSIPFNYSVSNDSFFLYPNTTAIENGSTNITWNDYSFYYTGGANDTNILDIGYHYPYPGGSAYGGAVGDGSISVSSCGKLDVTNGRYNLAGNIAIPGTGGNCINITAHNVTLDCKDYLISNGVPNPSTAIYSNNTNNIRILNCFTSINTGVGMTGYALYLQNVTNATIYNNSFNGFDGSNIDNSSYGNISKNIFNSTGSVPGLTLKGANNYLHSNTIHCGAGSVNRCTGFSIVSGFNNIIINSNFSFITYGNGDGGNSIALTTSINNTLINCTYNNIGNNESVDGSSNLFRKWWFKAYVNDTIGALVSGATVEGFNITGTKEFTVITDATGWTNDTAITEYYNNAGTRTYYTNHTVNASKSGFGNDTHIYNVTLLRSTYNNTFTLQSLYVAVTGCTTLNSSNTTYIMTGDITSPGGKCITFMNSSITFDCQGHTITQDGLLDNAANSVYTNYSNSIIKNCIFLNGDNQDGYCVYIQNASDFTVYNSSLTSYLNGIVAIYSNGNVTDCYFAGGFSGLSFTNVNNSFIYRNQINCPQGGCNAVSLTTSSNNIFMDNNITSQTYNINFVTNSVNNTIINTSYPLSKENVASGSTMFRKWWFKAFVNDTIGAVVSGATVEAYNKTGTKEFLVLTDGTGWTNDTAITEYYNNAGTRSFYTNHTINASKTNMGNDTHLYNVTLLQSTYNNTFTLQSSSVPVSGCTTLNVSNTTYVLTQDLTFSSDPCIRFMNISITFDCQGHSMSQSGGITVNGIITNYTNSIIKNCVININSIGETPILVYNMTNFTVFNSNLSSINGIGLNVYNSTGNITDNYIHGGTYGVYLNNVDNSFLKRNNISTILSGTAGLWILGNNNLILDSNINLIANSVYLISNSINNTFINCTLGDNEFLQSGCNMYRKWWFKAYVNDTTGAVVSGASVEAYNKTGTREFSILTDGTGWTNDTALTEYYNNAGTRYYYTNHTINASKTNMGNDTHLYNVTLLQSTYNNTFTLDGKIVINLTMITPSNLNIFQQVEQNRFFKVSINVTCQLGNCSYINVTLDPEVLPSLLWNKSYDSGGIDILLGMVVDSTGNVYLTGNGSNKYNVVKLYSNGTYIWNNSDIAGISNGIAIDNITTKTFVTGTVGGANPTMSASYNSTNGTKFWNSSSFAAAASSTSNSIASDNKGFLYVAGNYNSAPFQYAISKINDSNGSIWCSYYTYPGLQNIGYGITVDNDSNIYSTGQKDNSFFTIKLNSSCSHVWNSSYSSSGTKGRAITLDSDKNVYVTGYSNLTNVTFDFYTIKYNSTGGYVWNASYNGGGDDIGYGIHLDSFGNIYVTGSSNYSGANHFYTIKYNSNGEYVWNISYNRTLNDFAVGLDFDSSGDLYIAGTSNNDYYVMKYILGKGTISTVAGTQPFYTNATTNPMTTNYLSAGESQKIDFYVNATGNIGYNYTFFAYANVTSNLSLSNITRTWNVSIKSDLTPPYFINVSAWRTSGTLYGLSNFSSLVLDDVQVNSAWLQHTFEPNITNITSQVNYNGKHFFGNKTWIAQSFILNSTQRLINGTVVLSYRTGNKLSITLELRANKINGSLNYPNNASVLATAVAIPGFNDSNPLNYTFRFTSPPVLTRNVRYWLVVRSNNEKSQAYNWFSEYNDPQDSSTDAYTRGECLYSSDGSGSWLPCYSDTAFTLNGYNGYGFLYKNETPQVINAVSGMTNKTYNFSMYHYSSTIPYYYMFCANDSSNNVNCSERKTYTIVSTPDVTKPRIVAFLIYPKYKLNGEAIRFYGYTYDTNSIDNLTLSVRNGSDPYQTLYLNSSSAGGYMYIMYYFNSTPYESGVNLTFELLASDVAGNFNYTNITIQVDHNAFYLSNYPTVNPWISPSRSWYTNNTNITLYINLTDGSGAGINYSKVDLTNVNGSGYTNMTFWKGSTSPGYFSTWNYNVTIQTTTGTDKLIDFYGIDKADPVNFNNFTINYDVDNDKPYGDEPSIYPGVKYPGTNITHQIEVYDSHSGLDTCTLLSNGSGAFVNYSASISGTDDWCIIDINYTVEGNFMYKFYYNDSVGNRNESNWQYVIISPPLSRNLCVVNYIFPLNDSMFNVSYVNVTGNVTNVSIEDISGCWITLDGYINVTNITMSVNVSTNFTIRGLEDDNYDLDMFCNNTDNIVSKSKQGGGKNITVDTTAPLISEVYSANITGVVSGIVTRGGNVTINASVSGITNGTGFVWAKIWQGALDVSAIIWQGFLNWISGNLWSVTIQTNSSWPIGIINFTIYANDSFGNQANFTGNITIAQGVDITGCGTLSVANTVYVLASSISDNTIGNDCIIISAQNITLDCNGYFITSIKNYSGIYSNQYNTTIQNCNVSMGSPGGINQSAVGIRLVSSNSSYLYNNTLKADIGYGLYLMLSSNNTFVNNSVISVTNYGTYINSSNSNLWSSLFTKSGANYSIYLEDSMLNNFNLLRAEGYTVGSIGIAIHGSNNTYIQDCINLTGRSGNVLYLTHASGNNTFVNCSYNITGNNETVIAGSNLFKKWWYKAYVNDSSGYSIYNVNITARNLSNSFEFEMFTGSDGWTGLIPMTEYVNLAGTRYFYSNYSINATKAGYTKSGHYLNITNTTNKYDDLFTFIEQGVGGCMNLIIANSTYVMVTNITNNTITNDCIIFQRTNITLDCAGYYITSTENYSGIVTNQYNSTIKNCNVSMGRANNTNSIGIELTNAADNSFVYNNTIWDAGGHGMAYGIHTGAEYTQIENNSINLQCGNCHGIYFNAAENCSVKNNNITLDSGRGIWTAVANSNNNTIEGNIIYSKSGLALAVGGHFQRVINNSARSDNYWGAAFGSNSTFINNTIISITNYGLNLAGTSFSRFEDNYVFSNDTIGVSLGTQSSYNNFSGNTVYTKTSWAFYIVGSSNNLFINNTFYTNSLGGFGLYIYSSSGNNTFINQTVIDTNYSAIFLSSLPEQNVFINLRARGTGIFTISSANHTLIKDCINFTNAIVIQTGIGSINTTFLNCTYSMTGTNETMGAGSELIKKWYYRAYVNDSSGNAIDSANIIAYNKSAADDFNIITAPNGWTNITQITEYINVGGTRVYYSNYSMNATKTGYARSAHPFNVSYSYSKLDDYFTFGTVPQINMTTVIPAVTGLGQLVNITANITNSTTLSAVWAGIIDPLGSQVNYSMARSGTFFYNNNSYRGWVNGTYTVIVYVNDTSNGLGVNSTTFNVYNLNMTVQIRTLQDSYKNNSYINLTDPPTGGSGLGEQLQEKLLGLLNNNNNNNREIEVQDSKENYNLNSKQDYSNNLDSSSVVNTLISHCSLKCLSLDQMGISNSIANAKNGVSLLCEINFSALESEDCKGVISSINSGNSFRYEENVSLETFDFEQIKSQYLPNSVINSFGANNSILFSDNNLLVKESLLNKENTMLVSIINLILDNSYLYFFQISSLNFLPRLMQSSSVKTDFEKSLSSFSKSSNCFILLTNASLAISDQFNQVNLSIFCLNSSGIDNVMFAILSSTHNTRDKLVYKLFGSLTDSKPVITNAYTNPVDVRPGDSMLVSADVYDESGISLVTADMPHEKGVDVIDMNRVSGDKYNGTYQNIWNVHDTIEINYTTIIKAWDELGKTSEGEVVWSDPSANDSANVVYQCGTIDSPGSYIMNQSITNQTLTTPCINITSKNVNLNCVGYYISSYTNYSGVYSNSSNTTIKNCNISMGVGAGGRGIWLTETADNSNIVNNTLNFQNRGYHSNGADFVVIENCTANNNTDTGIYIDLTSNNINLTNIVANNNTNMGMYLYSISTLYVKNIIANANLDYGVNNAQCTSAIFDNITASFNGNAANEGGIRFWSTSDGIVTNSIANSNKNYGIILANGVSGGTFINITLNNNSRGIDFPLNDDYNNFTNINGINNSYGVYLAAASDNNYFLNSNFSLSSINTIVMSCSGGCDTNNIFTNVSYGVANESVAVGSTLTRIWYYNGNATDNCGAIVSGANITAFNSSQDVQFSVISDSNGYTTQQEMIDYIYNGSFRGVYSNYSFNLTSGTYRLMKSHNITIDQNIIDLFIITSRINYTKYMRRGLTTDLCSLTLTNNYNVTNLIIDDNVNARIEFLSNVTVNDTMNLDNAISISNGNVFVNSTMYPLLNVSSRITLRGLSSVGFPLLMKDGSPCNPPFCNILSWDPSTKTVVFNVTSFSGYTAAESNQSKVQNNGTANNISFYLLMRTQWWSGGSGWTDEDVIINDTKTSTLRTVVTSNLTKLDGLWNTQNYNSSNLSHGDGTYRVLVELLDPNGIVLNDSTKTNLKAWFNFTLDNSPPFITPKGPLYNVSIINSQNNIIFNWTVNDSIDINMTCNLTVDSIINMSYIASSNGTLTNVTVPGFAIGDHLWNVTCWDDAWNVNTSVTFNFSVYAANSAPSNPVILINSSDFSNRSVMDLNCNTTLTDPDTNRINVTVVWFRNNVTNFSIDYNNSYTSGTLFVATLDYRNLTKGNNWSCGMRLHDGQSYSSWRNSSWQILVKNSLPNVTLVGPANNNVSFNRTPLFSWTGQDQDNDVMSYEFNISLIAKGTCVDLGKYVNNNTLFYNTSYSISPYLKCFVDNFADSYNWSVRAYDGENFSSWVVPRNITIQALITINLNVSFIDFGLMNISDKLNTTLDSPVPFKLVNQGNAMLNISVNFTNIWSNAPNPSKYYQYKARNTSASCYNTLTSRTSWENASATLTPFIDSLNFTNGYQTGCDNASIDIYVEVPDSEPAGNKSSLVVFIAGLGERF